MSVGLVYNTIKEVILLIELLLSGPLDVLEIIGNDQVDKAKQAITTGTEITRQSQSQR